MNNPTCTICAGSGEAFYINIHESSNLEPCRHCLGTGSEPFNSHELKKDRIETAIKALDAAIAALEKVYKV